MSVNWTCPFCNHKVILQEQDIDTHTMRLKFSNERTKYGATWLKLFSYACPNQNCQELVIRIAWRKPKRKEDVWPGDPMTAHHPLFIDYEELLSRRLHPESLAKPQPGYIPHQIIEDYKEACLIRELSPKASATLSRRCLQGIIRDFWKVEKEANLYEEIRAIRDKLDVQTWEAIDAVRNIGNLGAHMQQNVNLITPVEAHEAQALIELIETLFSEWYVIRHEREQRMKKLKQLGNAKTDRLREVVPPATSASDEDNSKSDCSKPDIANSNSLNILSKALRADLDFHGANSKHSSHGWHPFPAKFPPQLPQFFIERLSEKNEVVLDPMFGSGTTLLEALRLGRHAVGCDIDPLAQIIAKAKLVSVSGIQILEAARIITDNAKHDFHNNSDELRQQLQTRFDEKTRTFVDYWFLPQQQLELLALLKSIESSEEEELQKFFKMIFSSTIIAKSGGVSLARDLAHTRPHRVVGKNPGSAFTEFAKRVRQNLASHADNRAIRHRADIREVRADQTGLQSSSVDLIVTSPPYANNAIDYMRAHKFSLVWFGRKIEDLSKLRSQYLGHDTATDVRLDDLPKQCENTLENLADRDPKKAAALRRYFGEMSAVINEMHRVLRKGKAAVIVVGTSILRGIDVETQQGLAAIGESRGFDLAGIGARRLDRDKRMMPARWGKERTSQIEDRMHEEYVIGLIKP